MYLLANYNHQTSGCSIRPTANKMHYTLNLTLSRIDIMQNNIIIAFITAEYINHYPYFQCLLDNQKF